MSFKIGEGEGQEEIYRATSQGYFQCLAINIFRRSKSSYFITTHQHTNGPWEGAKLPARECGMKPNTSLSCLPPGSGEADLLKVWSTLPPSQSVLNLSRLVCSFIARPESITIASVFSPSPSSEQQRKDNLRAHETFLSKSCSPEKD